MLAIRPILDRRWPADGLGAVATLVAQLPDPAELASGTRVAVYASLPVGRARRWICWLVPLRRAHIAVRCTALLARGFRDIESRTEPGTADPVAWGTAG